MFKWLKKKKQKNAKKRARAHLESLSTFFPNSDNYWDYPALAYSAANNFPKQVKLLLPPDVDVKSYSDLSEDVNLYTLFETYGSDKSRHGYAPIYSDIIGKIGKPDACILEIGLGTNDPSLISSMGAKGKPGASLRAFRDYLPAGRVFGADIDKAILFEEDRIKTGWVDQTALSTFHELREGFGSPSFDLVVDDGLHSTEANLNTLLFWRETAASGGWLVVEDIPERTLDAWRLVVFLLRSGGDKATIYRTVSGYLVVAQRK